MTETNIENLIQDYLDTIYIISHSQGSVDSYRFTINHFKKFVQYKYEKSLEQIIFEIKNNSMDKYQIFQNFVIYLDKAGKKPFSIKILYDLFLQMKSVPTTAFFPCTVRTFLRWITHLTFLWCTFTIRTLDMHMSYCTWKKLNIFHNRMRNYKKYTELI